MVPGPAYYQLRAGERGQEALCLPPDRGEREHPSRLIAVAARNAGAGWNAPTFALFAWLPPNESTAMTLNNDDRRRIEDLERKLAHALAEARKWRAAINSIHEAAGEAPPYDLMDVASDKAAGQAVARERTASSTAGGKQTEGGAPGQPETDEAPLDTPAP